MVGDRSNCTKLADSLNAFDGVEVQQMIFGHD
jgi:hypothetical protein